MKYGFVYRPTEFIAFPEQKFDYIHVVAVNDFPMPIYVIIDAGNILQYFLSNRPSVLILNSLSTPSYS